VNRRALLVPIAFTLLSGAALCREPVYDTLTGRVRVLYLGDAFGQVSPVWKIAMDPRFSATPVPAMHAFGIFGGQDSIPKFQRAYLPRRYKDLVSQHDLIILSDSESTLYTAKHIGWFSDAVEKDRLGLLMVGGRQTVEGGWAGTTVEKVIPGDFIGIKTMEGFGMKPVIMDPDSEFGRSLPFKEMPVFLGLIVFTPKQGSTLIMKSSPKDAPILLYQEYGAGSSMIHSPDWCGAWTGPVRSWEYFPDFISNMLHMLSGLKIPDNPVLMHALRTHFEDFAVGNGMILSLVDFADKFGANTRTLLNRMGELNEKRADVNRLFIDQEYEEALEAIQGLDDDISELYGLALKLKDQALTWVYLTEVTALTGTSLIAGSVVWMLMVRRKLYREVATTRPKRMDWDSEDT
jgi:hypothetical protein